MIVTSGLLYMFYRYPQSHGIDALNVSGLAAIAVVHTAGAFLLVSFLIGAPLPDHHRATRRPPT